METKPASPSPTAPELTQPAPPPQQASTTLGVAALSAHALLAACGGGGGAEAPTPPVAGPAPAPPAPAPPAPAPPPPAPAAQPSRAQAARFVAQAALASTTSHTARVQAVGYSAWLDEQMALPRSSTNVEWLRSKGYADVTYRNLQGGADNMLWRKLLATPDTLRQRVSLAWSEIMVISVSGLANTFFKQFAAATFMDILEVNAFGSFRTLLEQVSTSVAMGAYLTFRGNRKADPVSNSLPDENYAREVMQLFSIGLVQLNLDGSAKLGAGGQPLETYTQDDVSQLARVFTGWETNFSIGSTDDPDRSVTPMVQNASNHESGAKTVLGTTIPAGTDGVNSLRLALDTLVAHPNVGPFIGRQLIQRLVTSNPSPAYVARVAGVFNDNGAGVRGDLRAVLRAVLLDTEARADASLADPGFGKLREPLLRFVQWARTFGATDATDVWRLGDLSDPATRLGQSPLRAPSVFNFFRPGYVPPNSGIGARTAPEFQITTESSVAGYVNFMQTVVASGFGGIRADYSALLPLVADSAALLTELNLLLAAGQLSAPTLATLKTALDSISAATASGANNRLYAALTLVLASPEYLIQK